MGSVCRATDTRLGRDVAIKILPNAFAQDADRMARFEREARVRQIAEALEYPHETCIHRDLKPANIKSTAECLDSPATTTSVRLRMPVTAAGPRVPPQDIY